MARPRPDVPELAAIFLGGALGALARAALGEALPHDPATWPWATFAANVAGAALLGWAVIRFGARGAAPAYAYSLVGPGLCGALTTFSGLQLELLDMIEAGRGALAAAYAAASLIAGLTAVRLTIAAGGRRRPA